MSVRFCLAALRPRLSAYEVACALFICAATNLACSTGEPAKGPKPSELIETEVAQLPNVRAQVLDDPIYGDYYYLLSAGSDTLQPPLLFVHGLGSNGIRDWYPLLNEYAKTRRVFAIDLPGFGRSSHSNRYYHPVYYANLLAHVIKSQLGGSADVVGHSMGGAISLGLAGSHPEVVRRLALVDVAGILCQEALVHEYVNPLPQSGGVKANAQRAAGSVINELVTGLAALIPQYSKALESATLRETLLDGNPERIAALSLISTNFEPVLDSIHSPTALVWGENDGVAPLRTLHILAARLPVQHSTVIPGAGHNTPLENPEQVKAALDLFFAQPANVTGLGVQEPTPAIPDAENPSTSQEAPVLADVECSRESGRRLHGRYGVVKLDQCTDVRLEDAQIEHMEALSSTFQAVNLEIRSELTLDASQAMFTGGAIRGARAVQLNNNSRIDLAGVKVEAAEHGFTAGNAGISRLVASVVSLQSGANRSSVHGVKDFSPGEEF